MMEEIEIFMASVGFKCIRGRAIGYEIWTK